MVYIKLKDSDGIVVSVEAVSDESWARYQPKNNIIYRCPQYEAEGIFNSNGNKVYQLEGKGAIQGEDVSPLIAVEIPEWEYEYLKSQIEAPDTEEIDTNLDEEQFTENVMTDVEVKVELLKLRAKDEATTQFFKTVMDPSTNSIAKIRAAAQQCIDYRNSLEEGGSDV